LIQKPSGDLQFERAEYAEGQPAATHCAACRQALVGSYYLVGARPTCERCKTDLELGQTQGSSAGRFLTASLYGLAAGAAGAGLWYAVEALTNMRVGLISIVVGLMVGGAVKAGSKGRGGPLYQVLAVFLTYTSIVSTYVPAIFTVMKQKMHEDDKTPSAPGKPAASAETPEATAPPTTTAVSSSEAKTPAPSVGRALLAVGLLVVLLFALAFAAPFLEGAQNIVGLLIIAFGLWEAWKINRRQNLAITGPYSMSAPPVAPAPGG
jgi:hypothetical protein